MSRAADSSSDARVVLVTGSARGLGLATARALRQRGDRVHVVWRSSTDAARELEREFAGRVHRADLVRAEPSEQLVADVIARDGRIDAIVHAVGEYATGPLASLDAIEFERVFASNVTSAFHLMNAARAALRASQGSALFFGCAGLDGQRGRRETAAYGAAKTALLVLVRSWALEEAAHGVRVNCLSPGIVPHPGAAPDTLDPTRIARIPLGRAGTPQEIAAAALFLLSDAARYTTGADLPVTGGWLA